MNWSQDFFIRCGFPEVENWKVFRSVCVLFVESIGVVV
jgi:hypothetical protein